MSLETVITEAVGYLTPVHTGLVSKIGGDLLAEQDAPPRLVWVPTSDSYGPIKLQKVEPRTVRTRRAGVTVYCWDTNFATTELLVADVIAAIHQTAHGAYDVLSGEWQQQTKDQMGRAYALQLSIEIPVTLGNIAPVASATILTAPQDVAVVIPAHDAPAHSGAEQDSDTIALWRFDESSGNAVDLVSGKQITFAGGAYLPAGGQVNGAREFPGDGVSTVRDTGNEAFILGNFTVEMWVRPYSLSSGFQEFIEYGSASSNRYLAFWIEKISPTINHLGWAWHNGGLIFGEATSGPASDVWSHVALRRSGTTVDFYLNGALLQTFAGVTLPATNAQPELRWWLGTLSGGGAYSFEGRIDDVRVSKVARSGAAILDTYNRGL